jgi:hypothetical protein
VHRLYANVQCHFLLGTWASAGFGIPGGYRGMTVFLGKLGRLDESVSVQPCAHCPSVTWWLNLMTQKAEWRSTENDFPAVKPSGICLTGFRHCFGFVFLFYFLSPFFKMSVSMTIIWCCPIFLWWEGKLVCLVLWVPRWGRIVPGS